MRSCFWGRVDPVAYHWQWLMHNIYRRRKFRLFLPVDKLLNTWCKSSRAKIWKQSITDSSLIRIENAAIARELQNREDRKKILISIQKASG